MSYGVLVFTHLPSSSMQTSLRILLQVCRSNLVSALLDQWDQWKTCTWPNQSSPTVQLLVHGCGYQIYILIILCCFSSSCSIPSTTQVLDTYAPLWSFLSFFIHTLHFLSMKELHLYLKFLLLLVFSLESPCFFIPTLYLQNRVWTNLTLAQSRCSAKSWHVLMKPSSYLWKYLDIFSTESYW